MATLIPTTYPEPFGCFPVEGMMCGVPALTSDFGAFHETVEKGVTGYRCKTLGDWIKAIDEVKKLDRAEIQKVAQSKYSYEAIGPQYTAAFNQMLELYKEGWMNKYASHYLDLQIPKEKNTSTSEEITP